jgi:hypothetical protein
VEFHKGIKKIGEKKQIDKNEQESYAQKWLQSWRMCRLVSGSM